MIALLWNVFELLKINFFLLPSQPIKVLQFILDNYPEINIEYTKHGNPKPGMLDMCDSIIIALAGEKIVREAKIT